MILPFPSSTISGKSECKFPQEVRKDSTFKKIPKEPMCGGGGVRAEPTQRRKHYSKLSWKSGRENSPSHPGSSLYSTQAGSVQEFAGKLLLNSQLIVHYN